VTINQVSADTAVHPHDIALAFMLLGKPICCFLKITLFFLGVWGGGYPFPTKIWLVLNAQKVLSFFSFSEGFIKVFRQLKTILIKKMLALCNSIDKNSWSRLLKLQAKRCQLM